MNGDLDPAKLLTALTKFEDFLKEKWSNAIIYRELPVTANIDGQIVNGIVDMLIETDTSLILIDHKSYPGAKSNLAKKSGEFRPQLNVYKEVLEKSFNKPVKEVFINFLVSGCLYEMGS
jgi:ATP-dependent exoDNAse (exonuclease V) beta subunit